MGYIVLNSPIDMSKRGSPEDWGAAGRQSSVQAGLYTREKVQGDYLVETSDNPIFQVHRLNRVYLFLAHRSRWGQDPDGWLRSLLSDIT